MDPLQRRAARTALHEHLLVPLRDVTIVPPAEAIRTLSNIATSEYLDAVQRLAGAADYHLMGVSDPYARRFLEEGSHKVQRMFWENAWTPADMDCLDQRLLQGFAARNIGKRPYTTDPFRRLYELGRQFNAA